MAAKHGATLIPKRAFIAVLTADGATVDGIHLTPLGHARMADLVWSVVRPAGND